MKIATCSARPVLVPCELDDWDYQVDPYIGCAHDCRYCYALNHAETDWTREILVHEDIVGQLSKELEKIPPQQIYLGYFTDPYQPCEAECRQTRKVLEVLLNKGFSVSLLTKSDSVVRDMDLLRDMKEALVSVSVAFTDNRIRRLFEANTKDTELRIGALGKLKEAGIRTAALVCPVIPYITDVTPLIDRLAHLADAIWIYGLSMEKRSDRNWRNLEVILKEHFPDMKGPIEEISFSKDHPFWAQLRRGLADLQKERQLDIRIHV